MCCGSLPATISARFWMDLLGFSVERQCYTVLFYSIFTCFLSFLLFFWILVKIFLVNRRWKWKWWKWKLWKTGKTFLNNLLVLSIDIFQKKTKEQNKIYLIFPYVIIQIHIRICFEKVVLFEEKKKLKFSLSKFWGQVNLWYFNSVWGLWHNTLICTCGPWSAEVPFTGHYNESLNEIIFVWGEASILKGKQILILLLVEILSDENSRTSIFLESSATSYVYSVPLLCRAYYARLTAYSQTGGIPQKNVFILANPFCMFIY